MDWYLDILKNYFGFGGRVRRKEYQMFMLINIIFTFVLDILGRMPGWERIGGEGALTTIYGVLVFIPWWVVQFRRLHDIDCLTRWLLVSLIPIVDQLMIIIFSCQDGTRGSSRLDTNPKQPS